MTKSRFELAEPSSKADAQQAYDLLIEETQKIEAQLTDKAKVDPATNELMDIEGEAYQIWRNSAIKALNIKRAHQRYLKGWMRTKYDEAKAEKKERIEGDPCAKLLSLLYRMFKKNIKRHNIVLDSEDQVMLDVAKDFIEDA